MRRTSENLNGTHSVRGLKTKHAREEAGSCSAPPVATTLSSPGRDATHAGTCATSCSTCSRPRRRRATPQGLGESFFVAIICYRCVCTCYCLYVYCCLFAGGGLSSGPKRRGVTKLGRRRFGGPPCFDRDTLASAPTAHSKGHPRFGSDFPGSRSSHVQSCTPALQAVALRLKTYFISGLGVPPAARLHPKSRLRAPKTSLGSSGPGLSTCEATPLAPLSKPSLRGGFREIPDAERRQRAARAALVASYLHWCGLWGGEIHRKFEV